MNDQVNVSVIYYSSTGNVYQLARAAADGATDAGAEVRLRKVRELAPPEAISANSEWWRHAQETADVAEATLDDVDWADVVLFGTPTRYGGAASQLRQFIDTSGPLWLKGALANKVYGAFTSAATAHGGHESTLLSLATVFYHWGGIIVAPGYTDPIQFQLGNPYGTSHASGAGAPGQVELDAARYQARRAVDVAQTLKAGRSRPAAAA